MLTQSHSRSRNLELTSVQPNHPIANLTIGALAAVSNPFSLYQQHVNGTSVKEIAEAFNLSVSWVEQRIEAIRLCVEHQLAFTLEI
jgi:DNA-binding NarL/FixJ family response regulator